MEISLKNKTAIVCGSTQGIGKASAIELANNGAEIILIARNEEKLKQTISELNTSFNQKHNYIVADFSKPEELKSKIKIFVNQYQKPIHILINNTGGPSSGQITEATEEQFINTFNAHVICNHILTTALIPKMKEANYGRIINIISTSVKTPLPNLGVSNTIRGAVASWAKTMANELGKFNITVNNVLPGATKTERLNAIVKNNSVKKNISIEELEQEMQNEIPMKRFAEASEVANAVAFLASPAAGYINGINLPVDGGRTTSL
ncbi:MAG: SDR family oxidoreductase [Fimbriimonadaceae bacterium]|nr:SDR family oxidoreductase [Chitinophagales bacterium]